MSGIEIVGIISGLLNVAGAIAGLFGYRKHQQVVKLAQDVERAGEAVILGVEAAERIVGSDEAKQVKQTIQTVAEAAGVEDNLHSWIQKLGLAKKD